MKKLALAFKSEHHQNDTMKNQYIFYSKIFDGFYSVSLDIE
jgi:hypothetical protein